MTYKRKLCGMIEVKFRYGNVAVACAFFFHTAQNAAYSCVSVLNVEHGVV